MKHQFTDLFGAVTAKRLCAYVLNDHCDSFSFDGFTERELRQAVTGLGFLMLLLLMHEESETENALLQLTPTDSNEIAARIAAGS